MKLIPDGTKVHRFSSYDISVRLMRELGHDEKGTTPPDISGYVAASYDIGSYLVLHLLTKKGKALLGCDFYVCGRINTKIMGEEEYVVEKATKRKPAVMGKREAKVGYQYPTQPCPPTLLVEDGFYLGFPDQEGIAGSSRAWRERVELQRLSQDVCRQPPESSWWLFAKWLIFSIFDCPENENELKQTLIEIKDLVRRMSLVPFSPDWIRQVMQGNRPKKVVEADLPALSSAIEFVRRIYDLPEELAEFQPYSSFLMGDNLLVPRKDEGFALEGRGLQRGAVAYIRIVADLPDFRGEYFVCQSEVLGGGVSAGSALRTKDYTKEATPLPDQVFLDDEEGKERLIRELQHELTLGTRVYSGGLREDVVILPTKLSLQCQEGRYFIKVESLSADEARKAAKAVFQRETGLPYPRLGDTPNSLKLSDEAIDEILGIYAWHVKRYGSLWGESYFGTPMTALSLGRGHDARKALIERLAHQDRANSNSFTLPLMNALLTNATVNKVKIGAVTRTCLDALVSMWKPGEQGHEERLQQIMRYFLCMAIERVLGELWPQDLIRMLPIPSALEEAKLGVMLKEGKTQLRRAEECGVVREKYPLLWQAFAEGLDSKILYMPEHGGKLPVNREYRLWETMFRRGHGAEIKEIVEYVVTRVNYSRRITQYFAAMLRLEAWLDRHAPREGGWRVQPKIVTTTSDELHESEGVSKRRSAMTPTVSEGLVLLPFVTIREGGGCAYSEEYVISDVGVRDIAKPNGGIFEVPFEEKLNGRDDYGLLYYTLTGSTEFSGYPTFLIILEHLEGGKRVHFHRVSPCRRIGGIDTLTTDLISRCYQYMAGNIPANEIDFQQGDLIFVRAQGNPLVGATLVDQYEGHTFEPPILYAPGDGGVAGNFLGTLEAKGTWSLTHQEHAPHRNPPGRWKLYRCKSFERNPSGSFRRFVD